MTRLDPDERDAIVCHELGHIANGSLWGLATLMPVATSVALIALLSGVATWFLMIPAFHVGLHRFYMRRIELDCDLRAARAMGFVEMATALLKIHRLGMDGQMTNRVRLSLIRATCLHPSLPTRLAWLRRHASVDQRDRMPQVAHDSMLLTWLMAAVWAAGVAGAWWLGQMNSWWAIGGSGITLIAIAVTPWLLLNGSESAIALRTGFIRFWKQDGWLMIGLAVAAGLIVVAWMAVTRQSSRDLQIDFDPVAVGTLVMCGLACLLVFLGWKARHNSIHREMLVAWEERTFERVLAISRRQARFLRKDLHLRHLRAGALAILGNRPQAILEFEELIALAPTTEENYIALASIYIDDGTPEKVLPLSDVMLERFGKSGMGHAVASRALRRLGRLDEALVRIEQAMADHPAQGALWAAAAGIYTDQGHFSQADEMLRMAGEKTPGTPQELIEGARLACRTEPPAKAMEKLQRAIAMLDSNPMIMRQTELAALRRELAEFNRAVAPGGPST